MSLDDRKGPDAAVLAPLPVRTKRFEHESMESYIFRLARENATDRRTVETWLIETGRMVEHAPIVERYRIWRQLGGLPRGAAEAPIQETIVARRLCRRCSRGIRATGQIPSWGLVCIKHELWIHPIDGIGVGHRAMAAERDFRHHLAPKGMHIDSARLRFAQRLVALAVTTQWIHDRQAEDDSRSLQAALYPCQIRIAIDLFALDGIRELAEESSGHRHSAGESWISRRIDALGPDEEPWRASSLLMQCVRDLSETGRGSEDDVLYRQLR